jgi:hypothetical protein
MSRKVTYAMKKMVAGNQYYKCNNEPNSNLKGLDNYKCPLWEKGGKNAGSFDATGYEIDHIIEWSVTKNDNIDNLQALCIMCHKYKTKKFMMDNIEKPIKIIDIIVPYCSPMYNNWGINIVKPILGIDETWDGMHTSALIVLPRMPEDDIINTTNITNITKLWVSNCKLTNNGIGKFRNLTSLYIDCNNKHITDIGIKTLTKLTSFRNESGKITSDSLIALTNLTCLHIDGSSIKDNGIKHLTNLISLHVCGNKITNNAIKMLVNLTHIDIVYNEKISIDVLKQLPKLISLSLTESPDYSIGTGLSELLNLKHINIRNNHNNKIIGDDVIKYLTNLTGLNIWNNSVIGNTGISELKYLIFLNLGCCSCITNSTLATLTKLKILDLSNNNIITDNGITNLMDLTELNLSQNGTITDNGIKNLTNIESLSLNGNTKITWKSIVKLSKLEKLDIKNNKIITWEILRKTKEIVTSKDDSITYFPNLKCMKYVYK